MARVLIADDEEGVRESLRLILENYDVACAVDGMETLLKLISEPFDVALMDLKMPKMDGLEVLRRIKQQGIITPILVLTAYQSVELAKEAVRLGAMDYLAKPFDRDRVLEAVRGILKT